MSEFGNSDGKESEYNGSPLNIPPFVIPESSFTVDDLFDELLATANPEPLHHDITNAQPNQSLPQQMNIDAFYNAITEEPAMPTTHFNAALNNNHMHEGSSSSAPFRHPKKRERWTMKEHRSFLIGLAIYGKGNWKEISKYSVRTKTPTQIVSHAQKYYIRQSKLASASETKGKRKSIHDLTLQDLNNLHSSSNQMH